ncbi:MAG: hypothetical protein AAFP83_18905 [Bacteroidota bacterium]
MKYIKKLSFLSLGFCLVFACQKKPKKDPFKELVKLTQSRQFNNISPELLKRYAAWEDRSNDELGIQHTVEKLVYINDQTLAIIEKIIRPNGSVKNSWTFSPSRTFIDEITMDRRWVKNKRLPQATSLSTFVKPKEFQITLYRDIILDTGMVYESFTHNRPFDSTFKREQYLLPQTYTENFSYQSDGSIQTVFTKDTVKTQVPYYVPKRKIVEDIQRWRSYPNRDSIMDEGAYFFEMNCQSCHALDGGEEASSLRSTLSDYAGEEDFLYDWIRNPWWLMEIGERRALQLYFKNGLQTHPSHTNLSLENVTMLLLYLKFEQ